MFSPLNMGRLQGVQKLPCALGRPIRFLVLFLLQYGVSDLADLHLGLGKVFLPLKMERLQGFLKLPLRSRKAKKIYTSISAAVRRE